MLDELHFPAYSFQIREDHRKRMIFDVVRKKFVVLTPEEWVRQHILHYLIHDKGYPVSLLAVETSISFNGMLRRCDAIAYKDSLPFILVECKASGIRIDKEVVAQIARYQSVVKVPYLFLSNGFFHLVLSRSATGKIEVIEELPHYSVVSG